MAENIREVINIKLKNVYYQLMQLHCNISFEYSVVGFGVVYISLFHVWLKILLKILCRNELYLIPYLIFVIFFTRAKFLENKIYTEIYTVNCRFFALNL